MTVVFDCSWRRTRKMRLGAAGWWRGTASSWGWRGCWLGTGRPSSQRCPLSCGPFYTLIIRSNTRTHVARTKRTCLSPSIPSSSATSTPPLRTILASPSTITLIPSMSSSSIFCYSSISSSLHCISFFSTKIYDNPFWYKHIS